MKLPPSKKVASIAVLFSFLLSFAPPAMAQEAAPVLLGEGEPVSGEQHVPEASAEPLVSPAPEEGVTREGADLDEADLKNENALTQDQKAAEETPAQLNALSSPTSPRNEAFDSRRISLPEVEKNSGALTYRYPLSIPPGRNGLEPSLSLSYSSQEGREAGAFGSNWSLSIPTIERMNKRGVDKLYSTTTPVTFLSSLDGELIETSTPGTYGARVEQGSFNTYTFNGTQWVMKDKNGTQYTFGLNASSRQDDPTDSTRVYRWMLEEMRDTNNNFVKYQYTKETGQIYPSSIIYTGNGTTDGIFRVDFALETRPDITHMRQTGFLVSTTKRVNRIDVSISGTSVRQYALTYVIADHGAKSLLSTITETGFDESSIPTTLPPTTFEYQTQNPGWTLTPSWNLPEIMTRNGQILEYRLLDITGDALLDVVHSGVGNSHVNNGHGWTRHPGMNVVAVDRWKMIDVNGDGLVDTLDATASDPGGRATYLGNGDGSWSHSAAWKSPVSLADPYTLVDSAYKVVDLNGDGLPEIALANRHPNDSVTYEMYRNTGAGWVLDPAWRLPNHITYMGEDEGWKFLDINGDGLTDMTHGTLIYLNTGSGWAQNESILVPMNNQQGVRVFDMNGDSQLDVVWADTAVPPASYDIWIQGTFGWLRDFSWAPPVPLTSGFTDMPHRVADVNGDLFPDLVASDGNFATGLRQAYISHGQISTLLKKITTPQGGSSSFEYKPSTQYLNAAGDVANKIPYPLYTVFRSTTDDGFGNQSIHTYQYEGGRQYFGNSFDKKFAGFAMVAETDPVGNVTKTYFHQANESDTARGEYQDDYFKIGKPYRVETLDPNGNVFEKTIQMWDRVDLGNGRGFVKLAQRVASSFDGDATHKDKAEAYTYDNSNGNQLQKVEYGEVTANDDGSFVDTGSDKLTTDITYAAQSGSDIIGAPKQMVVTDQSGVKIKESRHYYDALPLGGITKGNRTKQEDWKSGTTYVSTQRAYNAYGLVISETDPRAKVTTFGYDTFNLYPITSTNPLNQLSRFTYDYSAGKPKTTTDPNKLISQTIYDGLDRVIRKEEPDLTTSSTLVTVFSLTYTDTPGNVSVMQSEYLTATSTADTYSYLDGLGRVIQIRKEAEGVDTYAVRDVTYDARGLLQKESLPYFSSGTARTPISTDTSLFTTYAYDALRRPITETNVLGITTSGYSDWQLTTTDPNGKTKTLVNDAYGRLIEVQERNAGATYITRYEYNGNGNLVKVTDAENNIRSFTYDGLGRRLTAQDLHAPADVTFGTWTYTYDDAGNVTTVLDPKSQTVNYTYDNTNRVLTENFTGLTGTEVTYAYDVCAFGIGSLCSTTTTGATTTNKYNSRRLLAQETKKIGTSAYLTSYTYDRRGRHTNITNPDNSQVRYTYNNAGLVESVLKKETTDAAFLAVVTDVNRTPIEQASAITYANGVTTVNTHDPAKRYRLTQKVSTLPNASKAQDLSYTYDAVGNITQLVDASSSSTRKTVSYTYDDLHRLTSATATGTPAGIPGYTETYTYSPVGNLLTKSGQGNYTYAGNTGSLKANPHAATRIGQSAFTYDNNGNMLTVKGFATSTLTWDYANRITQVLMPKASTSTYAYDSFGTRVKTTVLTGTTTVTTLYPTKFYNIATAATKHLFLGDEVIATITGTGATAQ
ncbi:MAG: hypothetical protein RL141_395, partial [Candidatus Parcubacteria bacterium]